MTQNKYAPMELTAADDNSIKIIQITDSHIFAGSDGKLLGLETRKSFEAVIERVKNESFKADLILATGDLAQDASIEAYQYLLEQLQSLAAPCFCIPGNHDDAALLRAELTGNNVFTDNHLVIGDWQVVLLDTSVSKKVYGEVKEHELAQLGRVIEAYPDKHLLTVMHHHPVATGSDWLDGIGIQNAEQLFAEVANNQTETCFLWGHVHQDFVGEQNGVKLISTPSTCVQFKPKSKDFSAGDESPGYRCITLHSDGRVDTVLHRINDIEFTVDYSIKGY
ncbi:MAG: 3',5'-cyclic-AMP phosphodiesterase [Kangiellaceae bacterium]|jgi:Icc protein|nr:3',5'-cyclic-AMP phosphodiesterase [Kangiellaceae bacterium]